MNTPRSSRGLVAALSRRKLQVAAVALGALLVASAIAVVRPLDYRAQTRLEMVARDSGDGAVVVEQVRNIEGDVLHRGAFAQIVAEMGLLASAAGEPEAERIQATDDLVTELLARTEVTSAEGSAPHTWDVTIAHTSNDANFSLRLVEAIASRYQDATLRRPEAEQSKIVAVMLKDETAAREEATRLGEELSAFENENAAFLEGPERRLAAIRERIAAVERDEIGAQQGEIARLDALLAEEPAVITKDDGSQRPNPMYRSLQEAKLESEGRVAGARRKLSALRGSERELLEEVRHSPEIRKKRDALAAEAASADTCCAELASTLTQARERLAALQGQHQVSFAQIEAPTRPNGPVGLGILSLAGIGLLVGSGVGAGIAIAMDGLDGSFRQTDEVQRAIGLPTLGAVGCIQTPAELAAEQSEQSRRVTGLLVMSVAVVGLLTFAMAGDAGAIREFVRAQLA